jgi:hypothetical protein
MIPVPVETNVPGWRIELSVACIRNSSANAVGRPKDDVVVVYICVLRLIRTECTRPTSLLDDRDTVTATCRRRIDVIVMHLNIG